MPGPLDPEDKRYAQFRKLTEVSRSLTNARTVDEVLRLTVDRAAEILESDKAVLMLTNAEGLLSVRAAHGLHQLATERFGEPLSDTLMTRLQGLLGVDAQHFLGVPLVAGGEVTGILAVTLPGAPQGRDEEEWLLSAVADQAAVALEKSRLDETAEFRERLIGIVSHDLRNPISAVLLGANLLLGRGDLDERTSRTVARIQSAAERAARMIRDLLDYTQARLGSGIPLDKKLTDLHAVVRGVVEEMLVVHAERHIELHQNGDARGECDGDRLAQIVGNLLSNALAYSPPGTPIRVHTSGQQGQVLLTVHNLGEPIAPSHLEHIFEAMQRAAPQSNMAARSVGLGLYIVRHLVEAHGGTIDVASRAGEGTTFTVRLPAA
jgi:sigma-B regulation protein RsbU (phosphoserine phosphatase)